MIDKLNADIISAMKAKDKPLQTALRSVKSDANLIALNDKRKDITSDDVIAASTKAVKQREESYLTYNASGRMDLASIEKYEQEIISKYLPQQLSDQDMVELIDDAIATIGATTRKDMGKVMKYISEKADKGTLDMTKVSKIVGTKLS